MDVDLEHTESYDAPFFHEHRHFYQYPLTNHVSYNMYIPEHVDALVLCHPAASERSVLCGSVSAVWSGLTGSKCGYRGPRIPYFAKEALFVVSYWARPATCGARRRVGEHLWPPPALSLSVSLAPPGTSVAVCKQEQTHKVRCNVGYPVVIIFGFPNSGWQARTQRASHSAMGVIVCACVFWYAQIHSI